MGSPASSGIIPTTPNPLFPDGQFTCFSLFTIQTKPPGSFRYLPVAIFIFSCILTRMISTIILAILRGIAI